jgi:putative ABC transport system permease protein
MFWRKKRSLDDFDAEIRAHLAMEADELRECAGHSIDSEGEARKQFGNRTAIKEAFYEYGRLRLWDQLSRDTRHALHLFWRRPAFSAVVTLTLAVGIGATVAIFSIINAVLLRPLPYTDPDRLAVLWSEDSAHGLLEGRVSLLNFADWKRRSHSFQNMIVFIGQTFLLSNNDGTRERMRSARVDENFFPLLGVQPVLGRVFSENEEKHGEAVVVLSHSLWLNRFGGSAAAIGSDLIMDGRASRIVGVMPASFRYPFPDTEVWQPITAHPYWAARDRSAPRSAANWYSLARLRPGVSWTQAQSEMSVIARQLKAEYPDSRNAPEIRVVPLDEQTAGKLKLPLAVLFSSVVLVLLIACLNIANLLLARGSAREREFSMRRALGASRATLAQQLFTESIVLSLVGALLGLTLAAAAVKALIAFGPPEIPRLREARIDGMAILFTLALALLSAIVSGLWPAFRHAVAPARSREWTTIANRGVRNALVIGEFAIALILLAGAGLLVRSFSRLLGVDPGFRPEHLLMMRIDLHVGRTGAQQIEYFRQAIERVSRLPGVQSAAAVEGFLQSDPEDAVEVKGRLPQQPGPSDDVIAGPFFETVGIPLKRGRYFSEGDRAGSLPVAIINEKMAKLYWPDEDPIGKQFRFSGRPSSPWLTVIGVTADMRRQGLEREPIPQVFRPDAQDPQDMLEVIVRTAARAAAMAEIVRRQIQSLDPSVAKFEITTVEQRLSEQTQQRRFQTSLVSLFSVISLLLSAVGIYGLMQYMVTQRRHEMGVRMALGADRGSVLALVVRQGLILAGAGIAIGVCCALGLTHMLSSLLYGVTPTDAFTFGASTLILFCVAALACWLPARHATRIDPMLALRQD